MNKRFACSSVLLVSATFASSVFAAGLTRMEQLGKMFRLEIPAWADF